MTGTAKTGGAPRKKKPAPEEETLARLAALAPDTERAAQIEAIGAALGHKHFRVVGRAAALAGARGLKELVPQLLAAYPRFLVDPVKKDPKCIAKQPIVRSLVDLDAADVEFFLAGMRYQQIEPSYDNPPPDSAIDIRASSAMGLVATGWHRAIAELTTLLEDSEWRVRAAAARAISCGRSGEAEAVLRLKVLVGDGEPEVIGECFTGLLQVATDESVPFVGEHLNDEDHSVRDVAALALGQSRHPAALEQLQKAFPDSPPGFRNVLIGAAALHRSAAAYDWLISLIAEGEPKDSDAAVEALAIYERDTRLGERVQEALARRRETQASEACRK